jgi:hypothetical protein
MGKAWKGGIPAQKGGYGEVLEDGTGAREFAYDACAWIMDGKAKYVCVSRGV